MLTRKRAKRKTAVPVANGHSSPKARKAPRRVTPPAEQKSIFEIIEEIGRGIPPEDLAKIPKDLSINIDHYLYGTPKVEPWRPV